MRRKFLDLLPGFIMLFAFTTAAQPPKKTEAAANSTFSQVIREPDCYDYISTVSGTVDYIATFECEYRRPDGTALGDGSKTSGGSVSLL
jgi:hypothetical protein